jgi:hypothetical protein
LIRLREGLLRCFLRVVTHLARVPYSVRTSMTCQQSVPHYSTQSM